jgi:hypothetical protein
MKSLLRGASQTLFVLAGLLFFVGGRAISEFTKTERLLAEILAIGLAVVCAAFAMVAKGKADNLDDEDSAAQ